MHLLASTSGVIDGAAEAIDLRQSAGDIVFLSAADSELANMARAVDQLPAVAPSVRLANLMALQHSYSVDLYVEQTLAQAKLVVVRLLGGRSYWSYGLDRLRELADAGNVRLVVLPGGTEADAELTALSTLPAAQCEKLRCYLAIGGSQNASAFLAQCCCLVGHEIDVEGPVDFAPCGYHHSGPGPGSKIGIVFYRSVIEGGQTAPIDTLIAALECRGLGVSAIFVASLKDSACAEFIAKAWHDFAPDIIINATSFAVGAPALDPLHGFDCPVLQISLAGTSEEQWQDAAPGLGAKDLAMSVVLPELDGRIFTRAISFKADQLWHERTQCRIVTYKPVDDRIAFVAELAHGWAKLRHLANHQKHVAIVLANYPNKDGRIGNGVGYDTPASTIAILQRLKKLGYNAGRVPDDGNALIAQLQQGVTNARSDHVSKITLPLAAYVNYFNALPDKARKEVEARWGAAASDPFMRGDAFHLPLVQFGNIIIGIQPARGYNIDPQSTYHDPALVPPHGYFAFYFWLRHHFGAHAIIHNGKHGNLEWLPGKAVGLSKDCYPEIAHGPIPQLYPFIVNDPGEGTQAKRRTAAVIIDHLTPPLTRAESYGPMKDLEALVDEYYLASGLDPGLTNWTGTPDLPVMMMAICSALTRFCVI
jgi:cobaltochelatase CobN